MYPQVCSATDKWDGSVTLILLVYNDLASTRSAIVHFPIQEVRDVMVMDSQSMHDVLYNEILGFERLFFILKLLVLSLIIPCHIVICVVNILDVSLDSISPEDIILQQLADPSATATYRLSFLTGPIPAVGFETYFLTVHEDPVDAKCTVCQICFISP